MKNIISDLPPVEIRVLLLRNNTGVNKIARAIGVSHVSVIGTINGTLVSDRIRRAIAKAVNRDVKELWPSAYLYGQPRKPGRPRKIN